MTDRGGISSLNKALAVEVMGWRDIWLDLYETSDDNTVLCLVDPEGNVVSPAAAWRPASDWSDLGRVIERAAEAGIAYEFRLECALSGNDWYAEVRSPGRLEFIKWATTPTEALARAILAAARERKVGKGGQVSG